jgi:hypothetical protein
MIVACLWSHWSGKEEPSLDSFAAITDELRRRLPRQGTSDASSHCNPTT